MSYSIAANLLRIADMATARFEGVSLHDINEESGCDRRTAQRMPRALEAAFPQAEVADAPDRRRRWRLPRTAPRWLQARGIRESELAAPDMAARRAVRDGALTLRFNASCSMEVIWHLYQRGDQVELLSPPQVQEVVAAHRRPDFPALP
ncbi:hypothetical protein [Pseudooceanicola marinus]|uniref:hypothetical protein n=1 Tax=Pseudooceanicola marinus TaxID=396013 RepID=UPI001CD22171|nr:hypothetical protein [Pseudooceanicola marinus]MCA1335473.1 hypothetical protein [Pseudooceanicola marinus]